VSGVVYRKYNKEGVLLYVGCSTSYFARLMNHIYGTDWVKEVHTIRLTHFNSKIDALIEESRAIKAEKPLYNRNLTDGQALPRRKSVYSEKQK